MIRSQFKEVLDNCFKRGVQDGLWTEAAAGRFTVELPKHEGQGDFSTNMALVIAGIEKKNSRDLAQSIAKRLTDKKEIIERVEIAGPGFINIFINHAVWCRLIPEIIAMATDFGQSKIGQGRKVLVEFVSANPTGPLSIGHGRQAILGDSIARLFEATGHEVFREYYYNNAGRQMRVLGESTRARYLELLGEKSFIPKDGYQGEYIVDIAKTLVDDRGDSLKNHEDVSPFKDRAEEIIFATITATLSKMGIIFDNYYNERSLYENGHIDEIVAELRAKGYVYKKDDAVWFKGTLLGQEQDRVIIKSSGEPTYRLPDIAYHREKFKRNFDQMVNVLGSDHIATVPDVFAGLKALGYDLDKIEVIFHQFVTITRGGKQVKMSTRKATFITVDELLDEVGKDAVRFFFMMRKADSQLEFDLDIAKKKSHDNPVYYVQYAHARLCSILRQAAAKGLTGVKFSGMDAALLREPEELKLLKTMSTFPATIEGSALEMAPHKTIFYLMDLAAQLHSYYNRHKVITDNIPLTRARICLVKALLVVFKNGIDIVGLSAPKRM